jgi:hypothetical protein
VSDTVVVHDTTAPNSGALGAHDTAVAVDRGVTVSCSVPLLASCSSSRVSRAVMACGAEPMPVGV